MKRVQILITKTYDSSRVIRLLYDDSFSHSPIKLIFGLDSRTHQRQSMLIIPRKSSPRVPKFHYL